MSIVFKRLAGGLLFLIALALGLGIIAGLIWVLAGGMVQVLGAFDVHASREAAAWLLVFIAAVVVGVRK